MTHRATCRYARQAQDPEMCVWAAEIKLRAERRAGEMLNEMEKSKGAATQTRSHHVTTLKELGIAKMQSSRWRTTWKPPRPLLRLGPVEPVVLLSRL